MTDEVIREVRRVRHEISRRCGHDAHKVVAWYRAFQDELKRSGRYRFFRPTDSNTPNASHSGADERLGM